MKTTIAAYCRVSHDSQAKKNGTDSQKPAIIDWCKRNGISPSKLRWYEDLAYSGATTKRPQLQKLLTDIDNGSIKTVLCFKIDRISRSTQDALGLLKTFGQKKIRLVSVTEDVDFSGAMGEFVFSLMSAVSTLFKNQLSERVRNGQAVYKAKGGILGRRPNIERQDAIWHLRHVKNFSAAQIADKLSISRQSVFNQLKRRELRQKAV